MTYREARALAREIEASGMDIRAALLGVGKDDYWIELHDPWLEQQLLATINSREEWDEWRFDDIRRYGPPNPQPELCGFRRGAGVVETSNDLPF